MKRRAWGLLVFSSAALLACGGPTAGELTAVLTTPNTDDGAVVFTVTAQPDREIFAASAACSGCQVFTDQVSETELRGVVVGQISAGPVVRIAVSDVGESTSYTVTIQQVASRTYELRGVGVYQLKLE